MLKKIAVSIAAILIACTIFASPHIYEHIQFNNGNMLKITACHGVQPTEAGGFAMHLTVEDSEGNTQEVYTGRVAQWDKSEGNYINIKYLKGEKQ
jgi:hypothetical protein